MPVKETILTHEDFQKLLIAIPRIKPFHFYEGKRPMSANAFLILYKLLFYCALKPHQVFKLKKEDFDLEKGLLNVKTTANNPKVTTIPPILLGDVKNYLKDKKDTDYLFITKQKKNHSKINSLEICERSWRVSWFEYISGYKSKGNRRNLIITFQRII